MFSAFLDSDLGEKKPSDPVNGGAQVGIINADGTGFKLITSGPNNNAFPSFSPDGKHIVYRTTGASEQGLRILNLDDGSIAQLTMEWDIAPGLRREIVLRLFGEQEQIFRSSRSARTGESLTRLTDTRGNDAHLAWSPNGERLSSPVRTWDSRTEALYTGAADPMARSLS